MTPYTSYVIVLQGQDHVRYTTSSRMFKQLCKTAKKYQWPLEIWPAVDGSLLDRDYWQTSTVPVSVTPGKFLDKRGAWGCLLSHVSLWQHCVSINTAIIIMEHDAVITASWPDDLDITQGIVKLHAATKTKYKSTVGQWSTGAWAYTLTPSQAQALLEGYARVGAMAADKLIGTALVPWRFLHWDLVQHNSEPHVSTVSQRC